jgi:CheY-like chemotaxis protein
VEDEELLRLFAADLLEEHGFRVVEAQNAAAALKVLETRDDVRLLFTDVQMPGTLEGMDLVSARGSPTLAPRLTCNYIRSKEAHSGGNSRPWSLRRQTIQS